MSKRFHRRRTSWLLRIWVGVSLVLALIVVIAIPFGVYAWWQWDSVPAYWQANEQFKKSHTHAQLQHIADTAWNQWLSELTGPIPGDPVDQLADTAPSSPKKHAPSHRAPADLPAQILKAARGTRTIHLKPKAVNAWLQTRLNDWLANQGRHMPSQVSDPMISIDNGKPVVAFALHTAHVNQIVSVVLDPKLQPDGRLSLRVDSIRGGRLPMPPEQLIEKARQIAPSHSADIDRALAIANGQAFEPVIKLDSRQARLVGIAIGKNSIDLTIRHEKVGKGLKHPPPSLPHLKP